MELDTFDKFWSTHYKSQRCTKPSQRARAQELIQLIINCKLLNIIALLFIVYKVSDETCMRSELHANEMQWIYGCLLVLNIWQLYSTADYKEKTHRVPFKKQDNVHIAFLCTRPWLVHIVRPLLPDDTSLSKLYCYRRGGWQSSKQHILTS